jgi:CheY-like chemotaxis protein
VSIVKAAKDGLLPTAEAKRITLRTEFQGETCLVKGDPNRLRQVVWNLVLNAIKFTPRGGSVTVSVGCLEPYVRLKVSDTGEGIPSEFLPYVFDRFRQAEGSLTRKQGGLGLGLAVVRHLVELHGGNVMAESPGPDQGSTFTVDLPLAEDRRDPSRAHERRQEIERRRSATSGGPGVDISGVRVLLVEDDDDTRGLLVLTLKRRGADVTSASSSAEALRLFEETADHSDGGTHRGDGPVQGQEGGLAGAPYSAGTGRRRPFDVIIGDIGMPDEDGYQFLSKVRALPPEQGGLVPAIALTGYATRKDRERALAAGYQLHLAKPVEPEDLITAIANLVSSKQ